MDERQHNDFIISVSGVNIDSSIITLEEMDGYCAGRRRIAIIGTNKKTYERLDRINYPLVENYKKPKAFTVNAKTKRWIDVYEWLLTKFHNGMMVIEKDTVSDDVADLVAKSINLYENDIDIMICREGFETITNHEMRKANLLRIHANPEIDMMVFTKLQDFYKEKVIGLMIAQQFVNEQYEQVNKYFNEHNSRYTEQGLKDYVDFYEYQKQLAFFLYFHTESGKILGITAAQVAEFIRKLKAAGLIPVQEEDIVPLSESITVKAG
jgi:ribose 5-phosphate isomerase RpiB